jgi:hypothetical protein
MAAAIRSKSSLEYVVNELRCARPKVHQPVKSDTLPLIGVKHTRRRCVFAADYDSCYRQRVVRT